MILGREQLVAGHPASEVKDVLRRLGSTWTTREDFVAQSVRRLPRDCPDDAFEPARQRAGLLWDSLIREGLLEPDPDARTGDMFRPSQVGLRVASATLGKGHGKAKAQQALDEFLARCAELDRPDSVYPYRVRLALLFGSHADGKDIVGDVDLLVWLDRRHADPNAHEAAVQRFEDAMAEQGVEGPGGIQRIWWPQEKTLKFLRARSRILSIVEDADRHVPLALAGPHRFVYPPNAQEVWNRLNAESKGTGTA